MDDIDDFLEYADVVENENDPNRIPKRYIRDFQDPFIYYEESEFKRRYRFQKLTVQETLLPLVMDSLTKNTNRGLPVPPLTQLMIALRFYATGNFQTVAGDLRAISQATVSLIIKRVSIAIAEHLGEFITLPNTYAEQQENIRQFHEVANFPSVSACIDGTHILIGNPGGDIGEIFRNRKGQFSINVQVACGPDMKIVDIDARYPGSTHDNVIFERSALRVRFENREINGLLLGDSGYGCRNFLLTPVLNPAAVAEQRYNRSHIATRNIIERVFGVWKRRFPCLRRVLLTKLETSVAIICATAILHNICRNINDPDFLVDDEEEINIPEDVNFFHNNDGLAFRRTFILQHFQ